MSRNESERPGVEVREATPDDHLGVRRVVDAAMLELRARLDDRIEAGDVLVARDARDDVTDATDETSETDESAPILGALMLVPPGHDSHADAMDAEDADATNAAGMDPTRNTMHADAMRVDAVAVRRARRGQGIGSALVRAAAERHPRLTAEFDPDVRPFYEALGFEISPTDGDDERLRGFYEGGTTRW